MTTTAEIQNRLNGPALAPPPGVHSNFVDPKNIHVAIIVTFVLCISISALVFWMRAYTKWYIFRQTGLEDYISFLAWLMYVGYCVPCILVTQTVPGVHQWNVKVKTIITALFYINVAWIMYGITIALVKLSLLLQYLRIFVPVRNHSLIVLFTYVVIWSTSIFYLITTFFEIFPCSPREMFWNRLITDGRCFNMNVVNIAAASINCISDFVILLLPQGVIWRLQMPFRRKLGISAIFLAGLFASITSIVRLYYAIQILLTGDLTYNFVVLGLWTHVEITFGIICGSLPFLPRFFQTFQPKVSFLFKACSQMQTKPEGFRFGRLAVNRGDAGSLGCTGKGPYELQAEYNSRVLYGLNPTERRSSTAPIVADLTIRSLAPTVEGPAEGLGSVEDGPKKNRILKTVTIETVQEPRNNPATDLESQHSHPEW